MNSRWLALSCLTYGLTLAGAAHAQAPAETTPPSDVTAPAEEPPPPPPPPEPAPPPPAPVAAPAPPPAAEPEAPAGHGAGTIELRVQTLNNFGAASDALVGYSQPGIGYNLDSEVLQINIMGGAGYFLSPMIALGADLGYAGNDDSSFIVVAPYLKFVTGLEENQIGFVGEFSPGFATVDTGDANYLQLSLFAGAHIPLGRSAAFVAGAQITRADDFDAFGDGFTLIGLRYGLSVYLP